MRAGLVTAVCVVVAVWSVESARATIVFFDDFEPPDEVGVGANAPSQQNYVAFTKWSVSDGSVDLVAPRNPWFTDCNGSQCIDLDGTTNNAGILTTNMVFAEGLYVLEFDLSGAQRNESGPSSMTVSFGDLTGTEAFFSLASNSPWQTVTREVTVGPNGSPLSFIHDGGDNIGLLLDNVKVTLVPIPAAFWLLGSGLLGMIGLARRRS